MANVQLNQWIKRSQIKRFIAVVLAVIVVLTMLITLLSEGRHQKKTSTEKAREVTGIVDESFTEANAESAMTAQQSELEGLKKQINKLHATIGAVMKNQAEELVTLNKTWESKFEAAKALNATQTTASNTALFQQQSLAFKRESSHLDISPAIHHISFRKKRHAMVMRLDPAHYVLSNASVRAVVLGGADADASVNGQSKNNGVMLFKLLDSGSLPNGQHSRLQGCRVSANTFGDISSERAFATLYRLSCAHPGEPIIDKEVTGWVFYNGKVGIKGQPLMRDGKVMTWAGVSGALSGVAEATQYAQSIQQFGAFGATSVVPSSHIGPFAAYGGASKAAEKLSEYYVKRAEQYHPVIQVGSGNVVTIVFKDGFYLGPDEITKQYASNQSQSRQVFNQNNTASVDDLNHFNVPPEVLSHIEQSNAGGLK
jgi:conjugal transfer pilus assembly protein TraB